MRAASWICAAVVLLPLSVGMAQGAGTLSLPKQERVQGLNAGSFLLVPSLSLGVGYDSNLFYEADDEWEQPNAVMRMSVVPAVSISNRNPGDFRLALDGSATVNRYFSSDPDVTEQNGIGGDIALRAGLFERSPVVLRLEEQFRRVLERRNVESVRDFNRYVNRVGGDLLFKPGGGALAVTLGYRFVSDFFSDTDDNWGDLIYHDMKLSATWRFFPFTAALFEADWQIRDYVADGGHYGELTDSKPLRLRAGVTGFITKRFAVTALLGWGWSFHADQPAETDPQTLDATDSYSGLLAEVRLAYKLSENGLTELGYEHSFDDSLLANYVSKHRISLSHQQRFFRDLLLDLKLSYTYLDFSTLPAAYYYGTDEEAAAYTEASFTRADAVIGVGATLDYDISRYLAVSLAYNLELYNYDFGDRTSVFYVGYADGTKDYQQYTRQTLMGYVIVRY